MIFAVHCEVRMLRETLAVGLTEVLLHRHDARSCALIDCQHVMHTSLQLRNLASQKALLSLNLDVDGRDHEFDSAARGMEICGPMPTSQN